MRWSRAELEEWQARRYAGHSMGDLADSFAPDPGPESRLQGKIKKWADDHGYPCQSNRQTSKARGLLTPGWPDLAIILPKGRTLYIECKAAKGILRDEQRHLRQRFVFLGHEYHLVKSFRKFLELVSTSNTTHNVEPGGE